MHAPHSLALALSFLSSSSAAAAPQGALLAPPRFRVSLQPNLPGMQSQGLALNESGQSVGGMGNGFENFAVFWPAPGASPVVATGDGSTFAFATDVNAAGLVVGSAHEGLYAFTWQPGNDLQVLATQGPCCSLAHAIDDLGAVAGFSVFGNGSQVATLWHSGPPTSLGDVLGDVGSMVHDMNDSGLMVGVSGIQAARWTSAGPERLAVPGAIFSYAHGVNEHGAVVGEASANGPSQPILWSDGRAVTLPTLGGNFGSARSINARGWIVGNAQARPMPADVNIRATLWIGAVAFDLNKLTIDLPAGVRLASAEDVNDAGQIVGTALVAGLEQAFLLVPSWPRAVRR